MFVTKTSIPVSPIGRPGLILRQTVPLNPRIQAILDLMPGGALLNPGYGFDPLSGWKDHKGDRLATLVGPGAVMPTKIDAALNGFPAIRYGSQNSGNALAFPAGAALWPIDADYSAFVIFKDLSATVGASAAGVFFGNGLSEASTIDGELVGLSHALRYAIASSTFTTSHRTKSGTTAAPVSNPVMIQSKTGHAAGAAPQAWISSHHAPVGQTAGETQLLKNDVVNETSSISRSNKNSRLVFGAAGWDGVTLTTALKNVEVYLAGMVPLALGRTGTGNEAAVALRAALKAFAVTDLGIVV